MKPEQSSSFCRSVVAEHLSHLSGDCFTDDEFRPEEEEGDQVEVPAVVQLLLDVLEVFLVQIHPEVLQKGLQVGDGELTRAGGTGCRRPAGSWRPSRWSRRTGSSSCRCRTSSGAGRRRTGRTSCWASWGTCPSSNACRSPCPGSSPTSA